jgi:hypothetical protein
MSEQKGQPPAAHTPGPWVVYDMNPLFVVASRYSVGSFTVADCTPPLRREGRVKTAEANARLIAAAPDHALVAAAFVSGVALWRPINKYVGDLRVGGRWYSLPLDEFGVPQLDDWTRERLRTSIAKTTEPV